LQLAEHAHCLQQAKYSLEAMADSYLDVYRNLLAASVPLRS